MNVPSISLSSNQKTILVAGAVVLGGLFIVSVAKGFNQAESQVGSGVGTGATLLGGGAGLALLLLVLL